jgi:hypothetical protein
MVSLDAVVTILKRQPGNCRSLTSTCQLGLGALQATLAGYITLLRRYSAPAQQPRLLDQVGRPVASGTVRAGRTAGSRYRSNSRGRTRTGSVAPDCCKVPMCSMASVGSVGRPANGATCSDTTRARRSFNEQRRSLGSKLRSSSQPSCHRPRHTCWKRA